MIGGKYLAAKGIMMRRLTAQEGQVEIVDSVIWVSHITENPDLVERIKSMKSSEIIELEVDWFKGFLPK